MPKSKDIAAYLADYLKTSEFNDYCVNGIQVEGSSQINRIVTGVSISSKLIKAAIREKAEMIIVHHGLFWKNSPSPFHLTGIMKDRVKLLLDNNINLLAYHLPLDAHPITGNNANLLKAIDLPVSAPFDIGFLSQLETPLLPSEIQKRLDNCLPDPCTVFGETNKEISSIAVVSGGGASFLEKAGIAGADALISGEPSEPAVRSAEEMKMCFFSAGHYNTERFGPIALTNHIKHSFNIDCMFVDIPNPI